MKDVCLVVPTIREDCFKRFVGKWSKVGLFKHVDLLVVEDNPLPSFDFPDSMRGQCELRHDSWREIRAEMGDLEWVVPRRSDTVRSYGYWKAWKTGYKFIMTLDDDCYPCDEQDGCVYDGAGFVNGHRAALEKRTRWFNTLNDVKPRGIPFYNLGTSENVIVNHGLWTNVLDYDAPYQLANPIKERHSFDSRVVPNGLYFPMCGMNVMWRAEFTVLMYHLLMGRRKSMVDNDPRAGDDGLIKLPFDRFGDIWCGILMKKVADRLQLNVSTGMPYIRHDRASNPFANLKKEANGIEVNEDLWEYVDGLPLEVKPNPVDAAAVDCYAQLGRGMMDFAKLVTKYREYDDYFTTLGRAMIAWAELFKRP